MLSEKHTYTFGEDLIFIDKIKCDKDNNKIRRVYYTSLITHKNHISKEQHLSNAIKTVDSTEFFQMWMHFNNFKDSDYYEYVESFCTKVIDHLIERKIELHGNSKFERYDLNHLVEIYNHNNGMFDSYRGWDDSIFDLFDGGYTYHNVMNDKRKHEYTIANEALNDLNNIVQSEIDNEVLNAILELYNTMKKD